MLASLKLLVKKSNFSVKKTTFFHSGITFFTLEKKPDLDVPRWKGAKLTYLELSTGKDKGVITL
jgi:hypothetical protein